MELLAEFERRWVLQRLPLKFVLAVRQDLDVRQDVDRNLAKVADSLKAWKALPEALQVTTAQQAVSAPQGEQLPGQCEKSWSSKAAALVSKGCSN